MKGDGAEVSRVFVLSAEVDVRYALIVEVSTNSDPCVPTLCGGITVNTGVSLAAPTMSEP